MPMVVVTESGEWVVERGGAGDSVRWVIVVVPGGGCYSDGVAVSLLRKAGLLDTASAAGPLRVV